MADVDVQNEGKHVNICVEEVNVAIHVYEELQEPAENAQRVRCAYMYTSEQCMQKCICMIRFFQHIHTYPLESGAKHSA